MWIDSHAHIDVFWEESTWSAVRAHMRDNGVSDVIAIGGSESANALALNAAQLDPLVHAVIGHDRDEALRLPAIEPLQALTECPEVVGIGETGLDYHYHPETAAAQCALLEAMLDCASTSLLPVVIHTRDAQEDTLNLLRAYASRWKGPSSLPGVIHCFTGDWPFARSLMDLGFMISFSGIVTFKKSDELREVAKKIPDDLLLIETDAPYLAPVPYRGKRNEPAYVRHVGESMAATRGQSVEDVARFTADNTRRLFYRMQERATEEATG